MKKVLSLLTLLIFLSNGLQSQVTFNLGTVEFDPNSNGFIDVRVSGFRSMLTAQFSLNWDSSKFDFVSVTNINNLIPGFDNESFGIPRSGNIKNGQLTVAWFDSGGATLPDNSRLFTLTLRAKNQPCGTSDLTMTSTPRQILFASTMNDNRGNPIIYTHTAPPGKLSIKGTNCTGGGGGGGGGGGNTTELEISAGNVQAQPGTKVCVPITVRNYNNVEGGSGTVKWNPSVLSFSGIENNQVPKNFSSNDNSKNIGLYSFTFDDVVSPKTFPDGTKIFDVCFNVTGQVGQNSDIQLTNDLTEWIFTTKGKSVTPKRNNGRVTVVSTVRPPVQLIAGRVNGNEGSNTCVDITVKNFNSITAVEFGLEWDPVQLEFASVGGFNLPGLNNDAFNRPSNKLMRFSYSPANTQPVSLADDSKIFTVCFKVLGKCADQGTANINFVPSIVVGNEAGAALPFQTTAGSIKTNPCGGGGGSGTATTVSVKNVTCPGGNDGGINVNVSPTAGCNCVWKRDGATVQTNPATNCNLTNAAAGNYTLELTCNGVVNATLTQAITAPQAINIDGNVVNETCTAKGRINLTTTGGTPQYTYSWSNQSNTKDISNLSAGTFTVTVTDSRNCTANRSFTITNTANNPLEATGTVQNNRCFGENKGSITLNVTGACPDTAGNYRYTWSGPTQAQGRNPINLASGQYSVTITDNSTPAKSITRSFTVTGPAAALASTEQITANSISVTITGGTAPYTVKWSGGPTAIADNTLNATNLQSGAYTLNITDSQGCVLTKTINVSSVLGVGTITVTSASLYNGFGVSCNGLRNGTVGGTITGGTSPYTVSYSGAATGNATVNNNTFSANNLAPGVYTFRVTDAAGANTTGTVTITEPQKISITSNLTCSSGSANNGAASLQVSGGAGDYKFKWNNGATSANLSNVGRGTYTVNVEDKNGCQVPFTARIKDCDGEDICYSGISIITPNGDGANDLFVINCAKDFPARLRVYDRYGKQVYEQAGYDNSWNGVSSAGQDLPEGAYMWVLIVDSPSGRENYNGTLTIIRQ